MGSLSLLWRFLGEQPAELPFALVPWHLAAVMLVLGLFAALGVQYLLDVRLGCYTAGGRSRRWLALPSFLVLLVAVLLLLLSYGLAARAPELVRLTADDMEDAALRDEIGGALLAPVFGAAELATDQGAVAKDTLVNAILATPDDSLRNAYATRLRAAEAALRALAHMETDEPPETDPAAPAAPASEQDGTQGDTSPPKPGTADTSGSAQAPALGGAEQARPPGAPAETAKEPAAPSAAEAPATMPGAGAATEKDRTDSAKPLGGGPDDVPMTDTLERLALHWLTSADAPGGFAPLMEGDQAEVPQAEAGLSEFLVTLVDEIRDGVTLEREGWEHVAGSRFVTDVLSPWLTGQLRYLATLVTLVVVVFLAVYFFLLHRLLRWLNGTPALSTEQPQAPPQSDQHAA